MLIFPIPALGKNFNPQNTPCIPPVNIFVRLELEKISDRPIPGVLFKLPAMPVVCDFFPHIQEKMPVLRLFAGYCFLIENHKKPWYTVSALKSRRNSVGRVSHS